MVDIEALMRALPVSSLQPQTIALIETAYDNKGRFEHRFIELLEPPAFDNVPYIRPSDALQALNTHHQFSSEEHLLRSNTLNTELERAFPDSKWVQFFDPSNPEAAGAIPAASFIDWLETNELVEPETLKLLHRANEEATKAKMFSGPDYYEPWSLVTQPKLTPPKALIQYLPGPPWSDHEFNMNNSHAEKAFLAWREQMRPVANALEQQLGQSVYHFADYEDDLDDDDAHRFLVLHWCCSWRPKAAFVQYLMEASKASNIEVLKLALINPASFNHPFKMNNSLIGIEAETCRYSAQAHSGSN
ncbi:hypothetical protein L7D45_00570 [Brucella pseudogrignonensis]|uniref:hypothetical protein n=1 Tax=Brucella pseudogrignonensis TaxID=419475 RepID=UPI00190AB6ED|nr:hypothetical protein [Brucella pseudogrignonensis]MBK0023504.1 hypothetical protein [Ochrobactrum sp. S45]MBK0045126.1 hypothetical protein [Ochrobactrum sp. S46]UKK92592.1 hypothetical protein L7D45_00570 [Brucella pseudogrignonensis]